MLPPLAALRVFEAAARLASFSRAAEELNVTHAAVSHQIKQLEDWFGRPLFLRQARGVRLADDASALADALSVSFKRISAEADVLKMRKNPKSPSHVFRQLRHDGLSLHLAPS